MFRVLGLGFWASFGVMGFGVGLRAWGEMMYSLAAGSF